MKTNVPEKVLKVLDEVGLSHDKAMWNCHGTWVMYHKSCEQIAAHKKITFDLPKILEQDVTRKAVVMLVTGRLGEITEWSIGEATPDNNKNAYPFAMAEKRAKDRVILKLVGLHGDIYTDTEIDDEVQEKIQIDATRKAAAKLGGTVNVTKKDSQQPAQEIEDEPSLSPEENAWHKITLRWIQEIVGMKSQASLLAWITRNNTKYKELIAWDKANNKSLSLDVELTFNRRKEDLENGE